MVSTNPRPEDLQAELPSATGAGREDKGEARSPEPAENSWRTKRAQKSQLCPVEGLETGNLEPEKRAHGEPQKPALQLFLPSLLFSVSIRVSPSQNWMEGKSKHPLSKLLGYIVLLLLLVIGFRVAQADPPDFISQVLGP